MTNHYILGDSTLLIVGLRKILKDRGSLKMKQLPNEESRVFNMLEVNKTDFLWMESRRDMEKSLHFCKRLHKSFPELKITVFCENRDPKIIKNFFLAGVLGYLLPNCEVLNFHKALSQISNYKIFIDPSLEENLFDNMLNCHKGRQIDTALTKREKEVLRLIVEEHTTQEIANKLFISFCTVETHRLHLIQKMGVRNTAGLVREALTRNLY